MRSTNLGLALTLSALALTFASRASATENFPPAIQSDLSLAAAPHCALCHTTGDQGGLGTVNTPFGKSVRAHGLVEYDEGKLKTALTAMAADGTDSDGDCVGDIDELKAGTDPDTVDHPVPCDAGGTTTNAGPSFEEPRYGCGAHIARTGGGGETFGIFAIGAIAVLVLGTRRKGR